VHKRRLQLAALLAAALVVTAGALTAGTAPAAPQSYYLALGDSMAYGYQPPKERKKLPPSGFNTGYVDVFAAQLRGLAPAIQVVNYGCPGESIASFAKGGCPWLAEGGRLHDSFRGAQLRAALDFLQAHPGQVSPITITLWGNDVGAFEEACRNKLRCMRKRAAKAVRRMGSRLRSSLLLLRAVAPQADIIATGAWNFEVGRLARVAFLYRALDKRIKRAAADAGARVANVRAVFNPPGRPAKTRARICALTFVCSLGDPHPKDAGYRAMAQAFLRASGYSRP
jgi:lysophospholipase L1-like esterase